MNKQRCNAKTKSGEPCQNFPVNGRDRCRLHGGKQKRGTEHHHFRHGLYSKYASESLKEVMDELQNQDSESLMNPESEIKLLQALIISTKALQNDLSDLKDLEILSKIINQLVLSKQRSQQILLEEKRLIPATDVEAFLNYLDDLLESSVPDQAIQIMTKIQKFKIS